MGLHQAPHVGGKLYGAARRFADVPGIESIQCARFGNQNPLTGLPGEFLGG